MTSSPIRGLLAAVLVALALTCSKNEDPVTPDTPATSYPDTPTATLDVIAHALDEGRIDDALEFFSLSPLNREFLEELDSSGLSALANTFATAVPSDVTENDVCVCKTPWTLDDGTKLDLEMILARNPSGKWRVISW